MTKLATMSLLLLLAALPGCSSATSGGSTDAGASDGSSADAGTMTSIPPKDSGVGKAPRSRECRGTVSGALTGTFRCTLTLDRFQPHAKLVFALDGAPTGSFTGVSVILRPVEGEFSAPRNYQQNEFGRDTLVEIDGGGKAYLTGGPKTVNGDGLGLELRTIDPVSTLSGHYDLPNTNGSLDGLLVDENATAEPDGGAESVMLHIEF